jgi:glycosyltransferase involved in cell wall biosynthesis
VPSLYFETYGMVVAESLSFGVPVILSKNVGAKSLLDGHDFGYEFHSKGELKRQLESILLNPKIIAERKKAILAAKELVFDSSAVYTEVSKLYSKDGRI